MNATTAHLIETQEVNTSDGVMYVAHGPDGHVWLIKRTTREAALRDGEAYFLATRIKGEDGRWVLN